MNFVYIIFGNAETFHNQAKVSILSLYPFLGIDDRVHILTDSDRKYPLFDQRLEWHKLPLTQFEEWFGPSKFVFRSKILGLKYLLTQVKGDEFCYLDSDTFFYRDYAEFKKHIEEGNLGLHDNERSFRDAKDIVTKHYWKAIQGKTFAGISVPEDLRMWNAGLVAFSRKDAHLLDQVLAVTDDILKVEKNYITFDEQTAFALIFPKYRKMLPAKNFVHHYWGNKAAWTKNVEDFLKTSFHTSLARSIEALRKFPSHIPLRVHSKIWPKFKRSCKKRWATLKQLFS